jgi:hypothetical protein
MTATTQTHYQVAPYIQQIAHSACQKAHHSQWSHPRHGIQQRQYLKELATGHLHVHCFDAPKGQERPRLEPVAGPSLVLAWALRNWGNWILQGRPGWHSTEASDALRIADLVEKGTYFAA